MKLSIQTQTLLSKLAPCAEVAEKKDKGTHALSKHILLTASPQAVELRAFKQPLSIRATIADNHAFGVSTPGTVAVQADDLHRRIKALGDDEDVSLETTGTRLIIRGGTSKRRYEMGYIDGADFPMFPVGPSGGGAAAAPAAAVASVLSRASYAALINDLFVEFHGVGLRGETGVLTATASDGHRMVRASIACDASVRVFVPQPAAAILRSCLGDDGDVVLFASSSTFFAAFDSIEIACSRPAVEPPPYDAVLALLDGVKGPVVDRTAILSEIRGLTVDGFSSGVHLEIVVDGPSVRLRHCNTAGADNAGAVPCEGAYRWSAIVDARYMIEALRRLTADKLELCLPTNVLSGFIGIRSGTSEIATIGLCHPKAAPWAGKEAA